MTRRRSSIAVRNALVLAGAGLLAWPAAARAEEKHASASIPSGLDLSGLDRTVAPGTDFFSYANGTWVSTTEIPPDRGAYGVGGMVAELTNRRTAELIQHAADAKPGPGSDARRIADYYETFMDEAAIEAKGLAPLEPTLARVAAIADRRGLARELGARLRTDVDGFNATDFYSDNVLGLWVAQDLDDPTRYVPFLLQGGLDLPDRAYYLEDAPRMAEIRGKLRAHMTAVLKLAGRPDPAARAARVFELERRIALAHVSRADSEDIKKANNHWTRKSFDSRAPGLDWQEFFAAAGLSQQADFVVWQPGAVTGLAALVSSEALETWKDYLVFHAVEHLPGVLPKSVGDESFAFHATALAGIPKQRDRWKRAVDATNAALGDAVGQLYVKRYFPPSEKARIEAMVANLMVAFRKRIDALDWMTPETKARAKAKLAVLRVGVGYPERWVDYRGLEVVRGDAFGNAARAELFEYKNDLRKLGQPVDRGEWVMTPQTVNAVNLPAMNAMNFPAAILQPPFFDPARPPAMDYGAIGATIGHEISHSFDDQGAQFDASGRLQNWWTAEDLERFEASAAQLVKQYDGYKPFPDLAVNGKLTLSENIADVAGLAAAHDGYRLSLGGEPAPVLDGLSGDQQFFLSFAQSWRQKSREPALRQQVLVDSHAPGRYRALTVRNLDAWYEAFDVKPGQALYLTPSERVRMW